MNNISPASTATAALQATLQASQAKAADGDFKTAGPGHRVKDADGDYKAAPRTTGGAAQSTASATLAAITTLAKGG